MTVYGSIVSDFGSSSGEGAIDPEQVLTYSRGGNVREVSGNSGSVDDIVESELINMRARLEEERERL